MVLIPFLANEVPGENHPHRRQSNSVRAPSTGKRDTLVLTRHPGEFTSFVNSERYELIVYFYQLFLSQKLPNANTYLSCSRERKVMKNCTGLF